jgi:hypothetical protein
MRLQARASRPVRFPNASILSRGIVPLISEVRDLIGVLQREKAEIGVYISFEEPTRAMQSEAAEAGFYISSDGTRYPRLQLLTIERLLEGTQRVERLSHPRRHFKPAPKHRKAAAESLILNLEQSRGKTIPYDAQ